MDGLKSEIQNCPVKTGRGLLVEDLPGDLSEGEIRQFLQERFPNAQQVHVPKERDTNILIGVAFVKLRSDADVTSVINEVSNLKMGGRTLKISEAKCKTCEVAEGFIRADPLTGEERVVKLERCARCRIVWYCGKECQTQNWPYHKSNCKKTTKLRL